MANMAHLEIEQTKNNNKRFLLTQSSKINKNPPRALKVSNFLDGLQNSPFIGQIEWFKDVREGCIMTADSLYRSLQIQEAVFLYGSRQFSTESSSVRGLVGYNTSKIVCNTKILYI